MVFANFRVRFSVLLQFLWQVTVIEMWVGCGKIADFAARFLGLMSFNMQISVENCVKDLSSWKIYHKWSCFLQLRQRLNDFANVYGRAVRQSSTIKGTTKAKAGTLPPSCYETNLTIEKVALLNQSNSNYITEPADGDHNLVKPNLTIPMMNTILTKVTTLMMMLSAMKRDTKNTKWLS